MEFGNLHHYINPVVLSNTDDALSITSGASTFSYGSWASGIAAPYDIHAVAIAVTYAVTTDGYNFEFGVGPVGSPRTLITNIDHYGGMTITDHCGGMVLLPIEIPAGERFQARAYTDTNGSRVSRLGVVGFQRTMHTAHDAIQKFVSPVNLTVTQAAIGSFTAWQQLTAATSGPYRRAWLKLSRDLDQFFGATTFLIEVGIGAAGQEQVIHRFFAGHNYQSNVGIVAPTWVDLPPIPSGVRVALRMKSLSGATSNRLRFGLIGGY